MVARPPSSRQDRGSRRTWLEGRRAWRRPVSRRGTSSQTGLRTGRTHHTSSSASPFRTRDLDCNRPYVDARRCNRSINLSACLVGGSFEKFYSEITLCCKSLKTQGKFHGWEAGIRTPMPWSGERRRHSRALRSALFGAVSLDTLSCLLPSVSVRSRAVRLSVSHLSVPPLRGISS